MIRFNDEDLRQALTLSAEDRLRQANAAFRLYLALHRPYARPRLIPVDRLEDFETLDKEVGRPS